MVKHIEVYNKKKNDEIKMQDFNNFSLGRYIAIGVNNPKSYPKEPFSSKNEPKKEMTSEEIHSFFKNFSNRFKKKDGTKNRGTTSTNIS